MALIWVIASLSTAAAQNAKATRISPYDHTDQQKTPPAGDDLQTPPSAQTYPSDTIYFPVSIDQAVLLEGWTLINTETCKDIAPGKYTATTKPTYGHLTYAVQDFTDESAPCAGVTFPFRTATYTWKKSTSSSPQDFFSLEWSAPRDSFEDSDWLAELLPEKENTAFKGWAGSISQPTIGQWQQTTRPTPVNYEGVTVQESNPGGGGPDTCWFSGSIYAPFEAITGGTWHVESGNKWGYDYVGYVQGAVTYYRSKGRAPCGTSFPQQMQIQFATGDATFYNYGPVNTLGGNIGTKTVTSIRAGSSKVKTWP